MVDVQEIFKRMKAKLKEKMAIQKAYREALMGVSEYIEILEKIKTLRERKKQIEISIKNDFSSEFDKLDGIKIDLLADAELLSDAAMSMLMKGERVEVQDEYNNTYDPKFVVKFVKAS